MFYGRPILGYFWVECRKIEFWIIVEPLKALGIFTGFGPVEPKFYQTKFCLPSGLFCSNNCQGNFKILFWMHCTQRSYRNGFPRLLWFQWRILGCRRQLRCRRGGLLTVDHASFRGVLASPSVPGLKRTAWFDGELKSRLGLRRGKTDRGCQSDGMLGFCGDNFVSKELNFLNFNFQVFHYFYFFALTWFNFTKSQPFCNPATSSDCFVITVVLETAQILASASPRNPNVLIANKSSASWILLVACACTQSCQVRWTKRAGSWLRCRV